MKEQRVDGSWQLSNANCLRCILTCFERNNKVKIPSKQINKVRFYTSAVKEGLTINPWFLTGFIDGEWCFTIRIRKCEKRLTG